MSTATRTRNKLDSFTRQYIETALWSSTGDDGQPLDKEYSAEDITGETLAAMVADCAKFQTEFARIVETARAELDSKGELSAADWRDWEEITSDLERAGHDFWLTRAHHGAGFWDGDWPEPLGEQLTALSHSFRESDLYIGDDGKFYLS